MQTLAQAQVETQTQAEAQVESQAAPLIAPLAEANTSSLVEKPAAAVAAPVASTLLGTLGGMLATPGAFVAPSPLPRILGIPDVNAVAQQDSNDSGTTTRSTTKEHKSSTTREEVSQNTDFDVLSAEKVDSGSQSSNDGSRIYNTGSDSQDDGKPVRKRDAVRKHGRPHPLARRQTADGLPLPVG